MQQSLTARVFKFIVDVFAPVIVGVSWALRKTYKVFFGRMEIRMSREDEEKLGHEILIKLPFLFEDYNGSLKADETLKHPRPFDYAAAIVALDDLSLRFIRGRGEFTVQIATKSAPGTWEDLPVVLSIIDDGFGYQRYFSSFDEVSAALKPRMTLLKEALSPDRYPELLKELANAHTYERAITRQWQTEINRRLFPEK